MPAGAIKNAHTFRLVIGTCEIEVSPSLILDGECACSGTPATPYIGHLESGKRHPSDKVLGQLAKVLALDPRELFFRGNHMALEFVRPKDKLTSSPPGSNSARTHVSAACIM